MSEHLDHIHPEWGVEQVGWLGHSGNVYRLHDSSLKGEPGGFSPLYIGRDEVCGHAIRAAELDEDRSEATCPKCGHGRVKTTWKAADERCSFMGPHARTDWRRERLHRQCGGCHYQWDTYDVLTPDPA